MPGEKILIVEDEKPLVKVLSYNLEKEGYRVLSAADGKTGLQLAEKEKPALILLDVMLPELTGFEFLKALRRSSKVPVLIVTARKEEVDRVLGLELGADDYVTKPFSVREVVARVRAILRRAAPEPSAAALKAGELELDLERYEARVKGKPVALTPKEFEVLKRLAQADGRALTREDLLERVWGYERALEIDTNTVDQHVARLRGKLGAAAERVLTVKGVGYRLRLG